MSAGTGVQHSEHNFGDGELRFLQIWSLPDREGYAPQYGDVEFPWEDRVGRWLPIACGEDDPGFPIHMHADVHVYAAQIPAGERLAFPVEPGRQAYMALIEGRASVGDISLRERDALEIVEEDVEVDAQQDAHILMIEMAKI